MLCPCGSGKLYQKCCKIFHDGAYPNSALLLMRSRYSAYANHLADYIIRTTHPENPQFQHDMEEWAKEILYFTQSTYFEKLEIVDFIDGNNEAYVTFKAHLIQNNQKIILFEKSYFEKIGKQWLYKRGNNYQ